MIEKSDNALDFKVIASIHCKGDNTNYAYADSFQTKGCYYRLIGDSGNHAEVTDDDWLNASGWGILFPQQNEAEKAIARANLKRSLDRLPTILEGLV